MSRKLPNTYYFRGLECLICHKTISGFQTDGIHLAVYHHIRRTVEDNLHREDSQRAFRSIRTYDNYDYIGNYFWLSK